MDRLVIQIDGDASGLMKALKSAETRLNSFNERVTNSSRKLTEFIKKMTAVNTSMTGFNASIQSVIAANARLATSLNSVTTRMNNLNNATRRQSTAARQSAASTSSMNLGVRDLVMGMTSLNTLLYTSAFLFGGITKSVIEANSRMEKMTVMLKNISGYGDEASKALYAKQGNEYLWDLAENAPFKVDNLSKAFVKLKSNGLDPMDGSLKAIVDAISTFGGGSEELERASTAISQMLSKGSVQLEDLKGQLAETGGVPSAIRDMAVAAGFDESKKGLQQFFAAMKKGAVDSATTIPKLMEVWKEKFDGNAGKMMNTWDGLMARLGTSWQRMIVRTTQEGGKGSLFETIKSQVLSLTTWMSSQQGDQFFKDMTSGLATLVTYLADGIKWLYSYREEIASVAKVMATLWVGGRIVAIFKGIGGAMTGIVGTGFRVVDMFNRVANSANGIALMNNVLGASWTRLATAMGVFNATGQISVSGLARIGNIASLVGIALGTLYLTYSTLEQRNKSLVEPQAKFVEGLNQANQSAKAADIAIRALNTSTDENRKRNEEAVESLKKKTAQELLAARAVMLHAQAENLRAQAQLIRYDNAVQFDPTVQAGYGATVTGGSAMSGTGFNAIPGYGRDGMVKNVQKTGAEAKLAEQKVAKLNETMQKFTTDILKPLPKVDGGAGIDKATKDKLGDLDGSRSELVNRLMKNKRLEAELADDGKGEDGNQAIQKFDDHAEQIEEGIRNQVKAIKSQAELNALLADAKGKTYGLTDSVRAHNKEIKQWQRNEEALESLGQKRLDQDLQAEDALGGLDETYNSIGNTVDRYRAKLEYQYRDLLASTDAQQRLKAATDISAAAESRRAELLGDAAAKANETANDILDNLRTEDQQRQVVYEREMARIDRLIEENDKLNDPNKKAIRGALESQKAALTLQNKVDKDPFARWAIGVKDLKNGIEDSLTGSMDSFIDSISEGKFAFGDFAKSVVSDLAKVILKALIAKTILDALGLGSGSVYGRGVTQGNVAALTGASQATIGANAGIFHSGGMVGGTAPATRNVDAGIFKFAQKYHTGGMVGLGADEVPIIAQKGEGVFTAEQMKAMGNGGSMQGAAPPTINIINQTKEPIEQEQAQPRFDGERMIVDVVLKHANKPGPMRDMLKGLKN